MTPQDKARIKLTLEEMLQNLDNIQVAVLMFNGQSTWVGNPFELTGWAEYIKSVWVAGLLASTGPQKSDIIH